MEKADNLSVRLDNIAKEHKESYQKAHEEAFEEEAAARIKAIKVGHKHQNLLQEHRQKLIPQSAEGLEGCRTAFNKLADLWHSDKKQYLSALARFLNNRLGTQLKSPRDRGASLTSVTLDIQAVISSTDMNKI